MKLGLPTVVGLLFLLSARHDYAGAAIENLDAEVEKVRASSGSPAMSVSVSRRDGIIAHGVAGVRRLGAAEKMATTDAVHIGSVAKTMTGTLAGMLVGEGKLSWESKLAAVVPGLRATIKPEYLEVTLADLLSHESGLPAFEEAKDFSALKLEGDVRTQRRQFVQQAVTLPPAAARGTFLYSNAGFAAAAAMIEQAAEAEWEKLVRDRIAAPLKLTTLGFGWPAAGKTSAPWGHTEKGGALTPQDPKGDYQLPPAIAPAGDVHMSMDDLATFLAAHMRALTDGKDFLLPEVARTMHTRRARSGLGFGVGKVGPIEPVSTYSGSAGTFLALIAVAPNHNTAVTVSANAANDATENGLKELLKGLLARYAVQLPGK